jgi:GT2 family glycosyltransferase
VAEDHVAAVVLNWNRGDDTIACLDSLAASDWPSLTTIVVDNASDDDIVPALAERIPDAVYLRNSENLGFAGGMNTGIRRALELGADYVLLLNNDTRVDPGMVRALVAAAKERPDAGIVGPLEFFRDEPEVVASAGRKCDLRRAYQGPPLHMGERDSGQFQGTREIDVSSGTAMLVPAEVIRQVGLLDDRLFLYIEDVDWALRMKEARWRVYVSFDARLWHGVAASSGGEDNPAVTYYHTRNMFIVSQRHLPLRGLRGALRHAEILAANAVHAMRCKRPFANLRAVYDGRRDYLRGRLGPRPA